MHLSRVYKTIFLAVLGLFGCSQKQMAQYKFKILVDNNQIWRNELPLTNKLKCDGIWSIPANSAGNFGRDIPIAEWKTGFDGMMSGFLSTEDYWQNFPNKNHNLTKDIVGSNAIDMVCGYAEPTITSDFHPTTVISDSVIKVLHTYSSKPVIVLSRAYHTTQWQTEVDRALGNTLVGGVCFEQKPDVAKYTSYKLVDGIRAVLGKGKKAFLLLPPHFTSESTNYSADIATIFQYLKSAAPEVLSSPDLYFVLNCYNRQKDKNTSFYGGDDSVEGALNTLTALRNPSVEAGFGLNQFGNTNVFFVASAKILRIQGPIVQNTSVTVYSATGRLVLNRMLNGHENAIDLAGLSAGIYLVTAKCATQTVQTKIVINR